MSTATIKITFYPPPPPDGLPNYKPNGGHIYQIFNERGNKLVGGSFGPDADGVRDWALKQARAKGFSHYRMIDDEAVNEIPVV